MSDGVGARVGYQPMVSKFSYQAQGGCNCKFVFAS